MEILEQVKQKMLSSNMMNLLRTTSTMATSLIITLVSYTAADPMVYGPYASFQDFNPVLREAFPNLTAISYSAEFDDPLSVSQLRLGRRLEEAAASFLDLPSNVTLGGETRPANEWMAMAQAGANPLPLESPEQFYHFYMTPAQIKENADEIAAKSKVFTNTKAAENDFYEDLQSNPVLNLPSIVVRVTDKHKDTLKQVFGEELAATFCKKIYFNKTSDLE